MKQSLWHLLNAQSVKQHNIPVADTQTFSLEHIIPQSTISDNSEEIILLEI